MSKDNIEEIAEIMCETMQYVYPNKKKVSSSEEAIAYAEALMSLVKTDFTK